MIGSTRRRATSTADVARGLGALVVLTILVAGVPGALWAIDGSPLPSTMPGAADVWATVTSPDDGTFFLDVLIFAGWLGWTTFAVSVLVEIPAALRGVRAPALPGLATQQRTVAALVTAVAAIVPASQVAVAETGPLSAPAQQGPWQPAPPVTSDLLDRGSETSAPDPSAPESAAPESAPPQTHEVVAGDTLWDVADRYLGHPHRYTEIYSASTDTVQSDGRRLTDPDLILPGWVLTMPQAGAAETTRRSSGAAESSGEVTTGSGEPTATADEPPEPESTDSDTVTGAIGGLTGPTASTQLDCADTGVSESPDDAGGLLRTAGGVGAVLAAGLIGVLTARRAVSQRRRRAGQRLSGASADDQAVEIQMRHAADAPAVEFVDRALRTLTAVLHAHRRALPALRAARLTRTMLELYVEEPDQPPAPFVDLGGGVVWGLEVGTDDVLSAALAREHPAPFPGLVTLGHDTEDGLVLVDLEHLRSFAVDGPGPVAQALLTAVAAEFATSPWADDIRVTLVGEQAWSEFEVLETGRIRRATDVDRLLDELAVRAADDRGLLASAGVGDLATARAVQAAEAAWTPEILLLAEPLTGERHRRLGALLEQEPRVAIAALIGGRSSDARWHLRLTGTGGGATAVLEPLGMTLRPQLLDAESCRHVLNLVRSSDEVVGQAVAEPALRSLPAMPVPGDEEGFEPVLQETAADPGEAPRPAEPPAPRLIMLGSVEVIHTAELGERNKLGQLTELAMFVALNPGCDSQAIDDAIWPGSVVTRTTRNTAISKLRRWLGTDARGAPLLPRTEGRYTFRPEVRSDWNDWCELLPHGPQNATTHDLRTAVSLVQGRPLSGRGRRPYAWADHHAQDMIAAIVDACHELAVRSSSAGEYREALRVALLGLSVEPAAELLWRDRLKAEVMLGDRETVLESIDRLRSTADELGGDLDHDTEDLIEQILSRDGRVSTAN